MLFTPWKEDSILLMFYSLQRNGFFLSFTPCKRDGFHLVFYFLQRGLFSFDLLFLAKEMVFFLSVTSCNGDGFHLIFYSLQSGWFSFDLEILIILVSLSSIFLSMKHFLLIIMKAGDFIEFWELVKMSSSVGYL